MAHDIWDQLVALVERTHQGSPALQAFCTSPNDLRPQEVSPFHIPASDLMVVDAGLMTDSHGSLTFRATAEPLSGVMVKKTCPKLIRLSGS